MNKRKRYFRVTWYIRIPMNFWLFYFSFGFFFFCSLWLWWRKCLKVWRLIQHENNTHKGSQQICPHSEYHYLCTLLLSLSYRSLSLDNIINNNMICQCILCLLRCLSCPFISFVTTGSWLRFGLNFSCCSVTFFFRRKKFDVTNGKKKKKKRNSTWLCTGKLVIAAKSSFFCHLNCSENW